MRSPLYTMLAAAVLALTAIPVGIAVFVLGFGLGDSPCVLCWEQRIGMILIGLIGLFVLRYGPRPRYIGLSVIVGAFGVFMGLRHSAMHAARDIGQGFSVSILGAHTYTWAVLIYLASIVAVGALLVSMKDGDAAPGPREPAGLQALAAPVFLVVVAANAIQAFASAGPPPFVGQSDPVRFSFNPRYWVWSMEEWSPVPVSWRGRWGAEPPAIDAANADVAAGPLAGIPALDIAGRRKIPFPLEGRPTGLAYDAASDRFVVTTQRGVYVCDGTFGRVLRSTIVDTRYSVDLGRLSGAAFLASDTVIAIGENKSYVVLREALRADAVRNHRYFLESFEAFEELSRARLSTVRARLMYVMSLAFDPATRSLYTLTVPNAITHQLVVSRFDRADMTLSEEFLPSLAASMMAPAGPDRSLGDLFVTAATFADGRLYALSAAHATLLAIDPGTHAVVAAWAIPGLVRPTGMAMKGGRLYVVSDDASLAIVDGLTRVAAGPLAGGDLE